MDLSGLANLGWREVLIIISIVLAIYIVFTFLRLQNLKQQDDVDSPLEPVSVPPSPAAPNKALSAYQQMKEIMAEEAANRQTHEEAEKEKAWFEPPRPVTEQEEDRVESLERELVLLRKDRKRLLAVEQELAQFRKEVGGLRAEVMILRESSVKPQSPRSVSPLYNDAMEMAMQGHDSEMISQHCGISRAEADLVVALANHQN